MLTLRQLWKRLFQRYFFHIFLQSLFCGSVTLQAYQIVVSFTPSHIEAVKSRSTACRAVIYAHDLMNQEFFTHNSINRRFRAVIFNVSWSTYRASSPKVSGLLRFGRGSTLPLLNEHWNESNGGRYTSRRNICFQDTQQSDLPVGWPRSTLVYHFPTNMATLCAKLFKNNDLDGMVTT